MDHLQHSPSLHPGGLNHNVPSYMSLSIVVLSNRLSTHTQFSSHTRSSQQEVDAHLPVGNTLVLASIRCLGEACKKPDLRLKTCSRVIIWVISHILDLSRLIPMFAFRRLLWVWDWRKARHVSQRHSFQFFLLMVYKWSNGQDDKVDPA